MYSYEERMKAVQLYIESDCSETLVFNTLGYPSPNALRQWYREYMRTGTLLQYSYGERHGGQPCLFPSQSRSC